MLIDTYIKPGETRFVVTLFLSKASEYFRLTNYCIRLICSVHEITKLCIVGIFSAFLVNTVLYKHLLNVVRSPNQFSFRKFGTLGKRQ